ncbi:DUF3592 domain-containing protein [Streptomyces sp. NPDC046909]|uniref:DUF3592 domain-containing protein n=1 Tax=Streptomyces sp. NPDC046909 TaxID=3155617 RepID=UPI00340FE348
MSNMAGVGFTLVGLGALICFLNLTGLLKFLKQRKLQRRGVEGEAFSERQEWIREGHRVYYQIRLPEDSGRRRAPRFIEVGVEPRGPVGTTVPVVYDPSRPSRAKTGTLADIDLSEERVMVMFFWIPGLACVAVGAALALVFW